MRLLFIMTVCGVSSVTHAQETSSRPVHAVTVDILGSYVFGGGVGYEQRLHRHLAVRGGVGTYGSGSPVLSATVVGLVGGRRVEVEGGVGAGVQAEEGFLPHVYGGIRWSLPVGRTLDGTREISRDLVVRVGVALVVDLGLSDEISPPFVVPSVGVGYAF